jgi:glutamine synthetase
MTPKQVLQLIKTQKIEFIDCRFMDFPGTWQHIMFPVSELTEKSFKDGFGFDGSCIRGWQAINETDMLIVPVADTAHVDPFPQHPTLAVICDVKDPVTKKQYSRDPRSIGRKAADYIKKAGIADKAVFGPEMEFFVFDSASYGQDVNSAAYRVDSAEGCWNSPRQDPTNLG